MSEEKITTLPIGFGSVNYESAMASSSEIAPGTERTFAIQSNARLRVNRLSVYGRPGARLRLTSFQLPESELLTDLASDVENTSALMTTDISKRLDDASRTASTSALMIATVQNDGKEAVKASVVAEGFWCIGDGDRFTWEGACALLPTASLEAPQEHIIRGQGGVNITTLLPFSTRLQRLRIKTKAPYGALEVSAFQAANCNLMLGAQVPVEAFRLGMPLASPPLEAGCRITLVMGRRDDSPEDIAFSAEVDVLSRGQVKIEPREEISQEAWDAVRREASIHGRHTKGGQN
jgi:hypothetical protein